MKVEYEKMRFTECGRCGAVVLAGLVAGLSIRLATRTVPAKSAAVLAYYGLPVFLVERRVTGNIWASFWDPFSHDLTRPDRWLAVNHSCGNHRGRP